MISSGKLGLYLSVVMCMLLCACNGKDSDNSTMAGLPRDFSSKPDSTKVHMLLDNGMPLDSLAVYVCKAAVGDIQGVSINDFASIDAYIYAAKGEKEYEVYALAFDECKKQLSLVKKLRLYKKNALEDPDKIGYQLGLQYVNDVIYNKLTIGKVDREIADFRRACGDDEDTYNRFLKGFAVGISTRTPGEVPQDIIDQYGR